MNGKKVRRAGRRIQLKRLAKRLKESGTFYPAVFESPPQSSVPPQDVTFDTTSPSPNLRNHADVRVA